MGRGGDGQDALLTTEARRSPGETMRDLPLESRGRAPCWNTFSTGGFEQKPTKETKAPGGILRSLLRFMFHWDRRNSGTGAEEGQEIAEPANDSCSSSPDLLFKTFVSFPVVCSSTFTRLPLVLDIRKRRASDGSPPYSSLAHVQNDRVLAVARSGSRESSAAAGVSPCNVLRRRLRTRTRAIKNAAVDCSSRRASYPKNVPSAVRPRSRSR